MDNPVLEQLKLPDVKIAVVGATNDKSKYGNKIYLDLKNKGYNVFGINPKADSIEGDKAYPSLESLDFKPDIIDMVVPPQIGLATIQKAIQLGYDYFWLQPGSESDEIIQLLESNQKKFLYNACVMVQAKQK